MRVLLDAHALLWFVTSRGSRLSERARTVLADASTNALVGAGAVYEIAIKSRIGRLELPAAADVYLSRLLRRFTFGVLPIAEAHALRAGSLPMLHRVPWDGLLVAQAQIEAMPIVTADPAIVGYDVDVIW